MKINCKPSTLLCAVVSGAGLLFTLPVVAQSIVHDDLLTASNRTTAWQQCDTDSVAIDVTSLDESACAYRTTPAEPGITYSMTCGVQVSDYASITLAFLDEDYDTLATDTTDILKNRSGTHSVTLDSPDGTVYAAVGIYGEPGSGFQDCVLINGVPPPQPTKGSISGGTWFDEDGDTLFGTSENRITGSLITLSVDGQVLRQTRTDAEGSYYFGNLDIGVCYTITFGAGDATLQGGALGGDNDVVSNGTTGDICLTEDRPDIVDCDSSFISRPPVKPPADYALCGVSWLDDNRNGVFDGTDSVLSRIEVELLDEDADVVDQTTTDANGNYAFSALTDGDYRVRFRTPDAHAPTTSAGRPIANSSYILSSGTTPVISLPSAGNTNDDSACFVEHVNAGYVTVTPPIPPTIANDDTVTEVLGNDFTINVIGNDAPCNNAVQEVNLLGHNVPGRVVYNASSNRFSVTGVTTSGVYTITYGLRGRCGSYDTATVTITITDPPPVISPDAPDAPICRIETGGNSANGGVDVFNPSRDGFSPQYNLYDRNRNLVITLNSNDVTHKFRIGSNANQWERPFSGNWEIEWNGERYGYNQVSIHYVSAVENGLESALTRCVRSLVSPIALDLQNKGRIQRVAGSYDVDLTGDGVPETLGEWFAPNAGILINRQSRGQVDSNALFGNIPGEYADGFAKLATLDSNQDNLLSGDELSTLAIWIDENSDTIIEEHEVSELHEHQLVELSLVHYKFMSRAGKSDGDDILMEDVWLALKPMAYSGR